MLLGGTGLLSAVALACGHYLKEAKSPRVLMMLALAASAVNFSILGAFLFSVSPFASGVAYPTFVAWTIDGLATALLLLAGALVVLIPAMLLGFKTLVRSQSRVLTGLFVLGNALLLIPLRDPIIVALLAIAAAGVLFYTLAIRHAERPELKTLEGYIAQLLLFAPVAILLGRNIWLYAPVATLVAATALIAFAVLRQVALALPTLSLSRTIVELISVAAALTASINLHPLVASIGLSNALEIVLQTAVAAGLTYEISMRSGALQKLLRILASIFITLGMLASFVFASSALSTGLAMVVGIGLIYVGVEYLSLIHI